MEIWKDIKGFENKYQVSNFGRIKRLRKQNKDKRSLPFMEENILNPSIYTTGYKVACLGKDKRKFVHRIVAETFLKNPEQKREVNHKNGDKLNNSVENLEWATHLENMRHAYKTGLIDIIKRKGIKKISVLQIDLKTGSIIKTFTSINKAKKELHINAKNISLVCKGKKTEAGGYFWKYDKDYDWDCLNNGFGQ